MTVFFAGLTVLTAFIALSLVACAEYVISQISLLISKLATGGSRYDNLITCSLTAILGVAYFIILIYWR